MYDIIIIGGGPAGLTAGIYTSRARLKTLLIEDPSRASQAMLTALVENYPGFPEGIGGAEFIERLKKQAGHFGLEFASGNVSKIRPAWQVSIDGKTIEALSLIIATGARPRELGVPGEEKFRGRGVSYCATCDGAFFKDKDIVVVGGGDTAIEETLFLTKFAKSIKLIHRRDRLRATKILQERAIDNKKIEFVWNTIVKEILGKDTVEGVKTNKETIIPCSGVFIFAGYIPNTDSIRGIVDLDKDGYIITDENMQTSGKGIFACGDCRKKIFRQIITACGDGATAAFSCQQYVENLKEVAYDPRKIV
jgi:thioredoxin reductase (NADPH)